MARKQAPGFVGSARVKTFLVGFRWLSLLLGILLMMVNSGRPMAPPPGILSGLQFVVIGALVLYECCGSFFFVRLVDQPANLYALLVLDIGVGGLLSWFYGSDFFMLAFALPVLQATYILGGFSGLLVTIVIGCYYFLLVGRQLLMLFGLDQAKVTLDQTVRALALTRFEELGASAVVLLCLAWVMSTIRGDEQDVMELRKKHNEEKNLLFEELHTTKKEIIELFNELEKGRHDQGSSQHQLDEANANLEKTYKKAHELQTQLQAAQQRIQQREQQLATAHRRELDEVKKEIEEYQQALARTNAVMEASLAMNSSLHRDQAIMNIIENLMKLVPSQTCLLYSVETSDNTQELFPDGGASPYLEFLRNYTIKVGDGAVGWVARTREPLRIDKEQAVVEGHELSTLVSYEKSAVVVPLESDGQLNGVIYLGRGPANAFTPEEFDVAVAYARMASPAFNNALVYQRTLAVGIFDEVTGLYNALYFDERLTEEVKRARRYEFNLALLLIDIDGFTRFNDSFGQAEGNALLKDVSEVLREHTRETDVLSRLENDEFGVLLVESEKSNAILIGERIRMALEVRSLGRPVGRQRIRITISAGLSAFPEDSRSREELVEHAAGALLQARKRGGNQIQH